jgi:hypothetical protein
MTGRALKGGGASNALGSVELGYDVFGALVDVQHNLNNDRGWRRDSHKCVYWLLECPSYDRNSNIVSKEGRGKCKDK